MLATMSNSTEILMNLCNDKLLKYLDHFYIASGFENFYCSSLQHSFSPNVFDIMKYLDHFYTASGFKMITFIFVLAA